MNNTESIPENIFWQELKNDSEIKYQLYGGDWATFINNIIPQYPILNYRVDFAFPVFKIAIEIDGKAYHSTKEQIENDYERQKNIENLGWLFYRIPAKKILYDDPCCWIGDVFDFVINQNNWRYFEEEEDIDENNNDMKNDNMILCPFCGRNVQYITIEYEGEQQVNCIDCGGIIFI